MLYFTGADGLYAYTPQGETRREAAVKLRTQLNDAAVKGEARRDLRRSLATL